MGSMHETAEGLHAAGAMDKRTMRQSSMPYASHRYGH